MTKKEKSLNTFIDNTIRGFSTTLEVAKENAWTFSQFMDSVDIDHNICLGALIFGNIYEKNIDDETFNAMKNRLHEGMWEVIKKY